MLFTNGFVKVHRSFLDWEWYDDGNCVRVFFHLLLNVNWETKKWRGKTILPGQIITSMDGLGRKLGLSRSSVVRVFSKLESTGEVTIDANNKWTLVTIVNWAKYQDADQPSGQQNEQRANNGRTTGEQQPDTTEEGKEIQEGKKKRVRASAPPTLDLETRRAAFAAECKAVIEVEPARLPVSERKGFFAYWTETSKSGRMRFEKEEFFVHARRMDTWRGNSERDSRFQPAQKAQEETRAPGWQNRAPAPEQQSA